MSVVIKGMKMPESCSECRLYVENCWCVAIEKENWRKAYNTPPEGERLPDCPLAPHPEKHGDHMDKAAFESEIRNRYCHGCDNSNGIKCRACWVDDMLDEVACAPTVIAAEGGGDSGN